MKKHLKHFWSLYLYLIVQITLATLDYKEIINWKWIYIWMPSFIVVTLLLLTFFLGCVCGIKEEYPYDRNGV